MAGVLYLVWLVYTVYMKPLEHQINRMSRACIIIL